jgi:hypothetical protein
MPEYSAFGRYKPTGPWLPATGPTDGFATGGFFADHPSFGVASESAVRPDGGGPFYRLGSSETPGDSVVGNIWEWTSRACRLCGVDLVQLECSTTNEQLVDGDTMPVRPLGTVRLELASDPEFTNGFFVEWETVKDSETVIGPTVKIYNPNTSDLVGENANLSDPRFVYHPNDNTTTSADVSPHVLTPLPSWTTQQFTPSRLGFDVPVELSTFPIFLTRAGSVFDRDLFSGGQPITFVRSVMRFGKLDGSEIVERQDRGWEVPLLWPRTFMTIGVHNNKAVGSVNGSYFRQVIPSDDHRFLTRQRWARVRSTTAQTNTVLVTLRDGTLQGGFLQVQPNVASVVSVQAAAPRVGVPTCRTIVNSDVTSSQRTLAERNAATGPSPLLCNYLRQPTTDLHAATVSTNPAQQWLAERLESPAAFDQPSGHPAQLTLNAAAVGRSLSVTTEFEFVDIQQSGVTNVPQWQSDTPNGLEDAKLPTVGIVPRAGGLGQNLLNGEGWFIQPEWTPADVSAPDWVGDPTLAGSTTPVRTATERQWCGVRFDPPTKPWLRFGDRGSPTTFAMAPNGGMASYLGNTPGGPELTLLNTYDMPLFRSGQTLLTAVLGSGNLLPRDGSHLYAVTDGPTTTLQNGAQTLQQTIEQTVEGNFLVDQFTPDARYIGPFPTLPVHQIYADQLEWAIIESASCQALQCDYAASIERVVSNALAPIYTTQQAGQDPAIPMTKVTDPSQRFIRASQGAWVRIKWRKTWRGVINVLYANFGCSGSVTQFVAGQRPNGLGNPAIDIPGFEETVTFSWPGPRQRRKKFEFLFEDYFNTDILLTESEWESLEQGDQVQVELVASGPVRYFRRSSGQPPVIDFANSGAAFDDSAPGVWPYRFTLPPTRASFRVDGRLLMSLQFTP